MSDTDIDVVHQAYTWMKERHTVVLATVVKTWGSAPRKAGSHMAVREDGLFVGSVSGGCIEGAVIQAGLEGGESVGRLMDFGVSNESAWEVGLACGGRISVWIEAVDADILERIMMHHEQRQCCAVVISALPEKKTTFVTSWEGSYTAKSLLQPDETFLRVYQPCRRLFLIGAVHIAQSLAPMARQVGYDVVVIDPRGLFVHPQRWSGVTRVDAYPDEYFEREALGARDAVVTLSHDPKFDDPALVCALASDSFYIGALGSRKTHAARCERLVQNGFDTSSIERIHGPVGLSISASTPVEIAVSILADLIAHQGRL